MSGGVRGVGVDIVDLGAFAASLAEPGTRLTNAFSPTERRQCRERAEARGAAPAGEFSSSSPLLSPSSLSARRGSAPAANQDSPAHRDPPAHRDADPLARHLAGRWAVKEAVVKAWSAALYGSPPAIAPDLLVWSEIGTVCDAWGRPSVRLSGEVARQVAATVGENVRWNVSLSHDGGSAVAFVVLETGAPQ